MFIDESGFMMCQGSMSSSCPRMPPYAPELNPVEPLWGYLKMKSLSNLAALDLPELTRVSRYQSRLLKKKPDLLRSLAQSSPLFSRPT